MRCPRPSALLVGCAAPAAPMPSAAAQGAGACCGRAHTKRRCNVGLQAKRRKWRQAGAAACGVLHEVLQQLDIAVRGLILLLRSALTIPIPILCLILAAAVRAAICSGRRLARLQPGCA